MQNDQTFDGFWFLPCDEEGLKLSFFTFGEEFGGGTPIGGIVQLVMFTIWPFFKENEEGMPEFDDAFEAILGDPESYIKNLVGAGLYGCVVKKTTKSGKWFEDYLTSVVGSVIVNSVKSITNMK
jgi:hypothetical protein